MHDNVMLRMHCATVAADVAAVVSANVALKHRAPVNHKPVGIIMSNKLRRPADAERNL